MLNERNEKKKNTKRLLIEWIGNDITIFLIITSLVKGEKN